MTPKQFNFIVSLAGEREIPSDVQGAYVTRLVAREAPEPSPAQASAIIEWLLALPRTTVAASEAVDVPQGRYAVVNSSTGVTEFFIVDKPEDGKWAGYTFVKQQASDDKYPVKGARKAEVLARIAVEPEAALLRYGLELGCCGRCGRTLTDEVSRAQGIGPDCAQILGIARPSLEEVVAAPMWDGVGPAKLDEHGDVIGPADPVEVVESHPVFAAFSPEARATIARNAKQVDDAPSVVALPMPSAKRSDPKLGWRERKAAVKAQQGEGVKRDTTPRPSSQMSELPGESWEDIFA